MRSQVSYQAAQEQQVNLKMHRSADTLHEGYSDLMLSMPPQRQCVCKTSSDPNVNEGNLYDASVAY